MNGHPGAEAAWREIPQDLQGIALGDREPLPLAGRHHGGIAVDTASIHPSLLEQAEHLAPATPQLQDR